MRTGKRILLIAALALFGLATPAFASSHGGSCATMDTGQHNAGISSIQPWNGGGSNAMNDIASLQGRVTVAPFNSSSNVAWNGGGSNATLHIGAPSDFTASQGSMGSHLVTPWNGGGSNAMSESAATPSGC